MTLFEQPNLKNNRAFTNPVTSKAVQVLARLSAAIKPTTKWQHFALPFGTISLCH